MMERETVPSGKFILVCRVFFRLVRHHNDPLARTFSLHLACNVRHAGYVEPSTFLPAGHCNSVIIEDFISNIDAGRDRRPQR